MHPLTAWSPGFSRSKPCEPPEGGTPNQPRFMESPTTLMPRIGSMNPPLTRPRKGTGTTRMNKCSPPGRGRGCVGSWRASLRFFACSGTRNRGSVLLLLVILFLLSALRRAQSKPDGFPLRDARCSLSLRERVRVRGNSANYYPAYQTIPGSVELGESSRSAGGFPNDYNLSLRCLFCCSLRDLCVRFVLHRYGLAPRFRQEPDEIPVRYQCHVLFRITPRL